MPLGKIQPFQKPGEIALWNFRAPTAVTQTKGNFLVTRLNFVLKGDFIPFPESCHYGAYGEERVLFAYHNLHACLGLLETEFSERLVPWKRVRSANDPRTGISTHGEEGEEGGSEIFKVVGIICFVRCSHSGFFLFFILYFFLFAVGQFWDLLFSLMQSGKIIFCTGGQPERCSWALGFYRSFCVFSRAALLNEFYRIWRK